MASGKNKKQDPVHGISMQKMNLLMAAGTLLISLLLLFVSYETARGYRNMRSAAENYIDRQHRAFDLQVSSDYLTEQVRCFTVTEERVYLDNYFEEAKVTRRRDKALEAISAVDTTQAEAYSNLIDAMEKSVVLMDREYYAMRLTVEAFGQDLADFPEEVQNVQLDAVTAALEPEEKAALARAMVFDEAYHAQKQAISDSMEKCLDALVKETNAELGGAADEMRMLLARQQWLILIVIVIVLAVVLLTFLLVISPLLRAIIHIRSEQPIPIRGSYEFRFLARTYNLMYEANLESREQLAYAASHDSLTGLYNRSGFAFLRENVDFGKAALLLLNIDKFKGINDTWGHDVGDRVLTHVAEVIKNAFRSGDYICRIGGDEFAVIMVAAGRDNIPHIRKKINLINELLSEAKDDLPPVSISAGAAFGGPGLEVRDVYKAADEALYRVKNAGGRGCAIYDEAQTGEIPAE